MQTSNESGATSVNNQIKETAIAESNRRQSYINTVYNHNYDSGCNELNIILVNDTDKTQTFKLAFDGELLEPEEIAPRAEHIINHQWSEYPDPAFNESKVEINIIGNITSIDFQESVFLTDLEVNNPYLKKLDCAACTDLRRLTVVNIEAVNEVHFSWCALDKDDLNKLFEALPVNDEGKIYIQESAGAADCDRSIAEKKGWKFEEYNLGKG